MHRIACERGGRIGGSPHAAGFAYPIHSAGFLIAALSTEDLVAAQILAGQPSARRGHERIEPA
jgi:hypothetical protein